LNYVPAIGAARQKEVRYSLRFFVFTLPVKRILLSLEICYTEIVLNEPIAFSMAVFGQSKRLG
jgi:hypothetical protein